MLALILVVCVGGFIAIGFIKAPWVRVPCMLVALFSAAYAGMQFGMSLERTRFISIFIAPLAQFGHHLDEIQDDAPLFHSKVLRWNEILQKNHYQISNQLVEESKLESRLL